MRVVALLLFVPVALAGCRSGGCCPQVQPPTGSPPAQVLFESTLVSGTASEVAAFLGPVAPSENQSWRVVTEAQAPRLEAPAAPPGTARQLVLPSVVTADSEEATIEVIDEPRTAEGSSVRAHGSARIAPDGSSVVLEFDTLHRSVSSGETRAAATGVTLRAGEVLVLVSPPNAQGRQSAALVRAIVLKTP